MKKVQLSVKFTRVRRILIIIILITFSLNASFAQQDSVSFKNTVRLNVTNPLIFGDKAIILGYERVLKNNRSFSVNIGRAYYPKLVSINTDSLGIDLHNDTKDKGINISGDYRFYLKKENKYPAPRGVYVGPFYSYNYFNRTNTWTLNTEDFQGDLETDLSFNIHTFGVELGYQFVFWDRVTVDMILIGPGVGIYKFEAKINTSLEPEDESKIYEKLDEFLSEKFPGYDVVIDGDGFRETGVEKTTGLGFRYMIMVGFRF
jgi:hypothetical protein